MTLCDPRPALAEHSALIAYLMGTAAIAHAIDTLALDSNRGSTCAADDFVHMLVGVASLGKAIEHLVGPVPLDAANPSPDAPQRWLR